MKKRKNSSLTRILKNQRALPLFILLFITLIGVIIFVQINFQDNAGSGEIRTKAYTSVPSGVRIEGEDMSLSGSAFKASGGTFIQFGQ